MPPSLLSPAVSFSLSISLSHFLFLISLHLSSSLYIICQCIVTLSCLPIHFIRLNATTPLSTAYNNTSFDISFTDMFFSIIVNGDPNIHLHSSTEGNITPFWPQWTVATRQEMLFNKTGGGPTLPGDPVIKVEETDKSLLERCEFWSGLAGKIGQ